MLREYCRFETIGRGCRPDNGGRQSRRPKPTPNNKQPATRRVGGTGFSRFETIDNCWPRSPAARSVLQTPDWPGQRPDRHFRRPAGSASSPIGTSAARLARPVARSDFQTPDWLCQRLDQNCRRPAGPAGGPIGTSDTRLAAFMQCDAARAPSAPVPQTAGRCAAYQNCPPAPPCGGSTHPRQTHPARC